MARPEDAWLLKHNIGEVGRSLVYGVPEEELDKNGRGEFYLKFGLFGNKHLVYVNEERMIEWLKLTDELFE